MRDAHAVADRYEQVLQIVEENPGLADEALECGERAVLVVGERMPDNDNENERQNDRGGKHQPFPPRKSTVVYARPGWEDGS